MRDKMLKRVGWLHFANDFTLDFLTPLLPAGVGVAWIGVMEGAADGIGQVLKLVTGRASDRDGRRVPWVRAGYLTNAVARPLTSVGLLLTWPWWIVACRIADRIGKGIRGSATDALVADWTDSASRARAYARMRVMDHLGATLGGLAATAVAYWLAAWLGWVVGALVVVTVWVAWLCRGLAEAAPDPTRALKPIPTGWWPRDARLKRPLLAITLASVGAKISPLLILAQIAGLAGHGANAWALWQVCLGWAVLGLVQAGAAALAGTLTDRLGAVTFLRLGWIAGAGVFVALAAIPSGPWLIVAGVAYGVLSGLTEGAEKTWLAELAPAHERALAFGALALVTAAAGLAGNAACGALLVAHGPLVFAALAGLLLLGAVLLSGSQASGGSD